MKLILSIIVAVFALVPVTLYAGLPVGAVTSVEIELNEGEGTGGLREPVPILRDAERLRG